MDTYEYDTMTTIRAPVKQDKTGIKPRHMCLIRSELLFNPAHAGPSRTPNRNAESMAACMLAQTVFAVHQTSIYMQAFTNVRSTTMHNASTTDCIRPD